MTRYRSHEIGSYGELSTCFKEDFNIFVIAISRAPCRTGFLTDQIYFSYCCRGSLKIIFGQIVFNSDHWFQRRRCLKFPT